MILLFTASGVAGCSVCLMNAAARPICNLAHDRRERYRLPGRDSHARTGSNFSAPARGGNIEELRSLTTIIIRGGDPK